jgi:phosphatidylinositol alpha-mannosyltransferase
VRIGVVCPYDLDAPGGVQQQCIELSDRLAEDGEDVVLIAAGRLEESVGRVGVGGTIKIRANRSTVPLTAAPGAWGRVREALSTVDVAHVHEPLIPLAGWAALWAGVPTVATFHADPPSWVARAYSYAPFLDRAFRRTVISAVSPVAARAIPDRWGEVTVVPNAIAVDAYDRPVERKGRQAVFLGRDDPRKGLDILLGVWPMVREAVADAELVVMGASRPDRDDGVTFMGTVTGEEKADTLASSGVYVAPNTGGESFGIVVVEAMAAGCAVVASDLPAFEAVLAGTGRLVPVGDPEALASALIGLLSRPEEARALGTESRIAVRRFDWPPVLDAYRDLYRKASGI